MQPPAPCLSLSLSLSLLSVSDSLHLHLQEFLVFFWNVGTFATAGRLGGHGWQAPSRSSFFLVCCRVVFIVDFVLTLVTLQKSKTQMLHAWGGGVGVKGVAPMRCVGAHDMRAHRHAGMHTRLRLAKATHIELNKVTVMRFTPKFERFVRIFQSCFTTMPSRVLWVRKCHVNIVKQRHCTLAHSLRYICSCQS